jgi:TatA/E family protein of Tat protein translocase
MGFENPVKLMLILTVALLIFGPTRLAGIGGALGRTVRDFRNSMREAQNTFTSSFQDAHDTFSSSMETEIPAPQSLPAPDSSAPEVPSAPYAGSHATDPAKEVGVPSDRHAAVGEEFEGPHSLASEPTAEALRKTLNPKG